MGPSGLNVYSLRRLCTFFGEKSDDLCHSLVLMAKRLCTCTEYVDPVLLSPFLACRLIALDKNPGVRPIGVGEIVRRIIAKAALEIVRPDILDGCKKMHLIR